MGNRVKRYRFCWKSTDDKLQSKDTFTAMSLAELKEPDTMFRFREPVRQASLCIIEENGN